MNDLSKVMEIIDVCISIDMKKENLKLFTSCYTNTVLCNHIDRKDD